MLKLDENVRVEKRKAVVSVLVCVDCDREMVNTGMMVPLNPPLYHHSCMKCGQSVETKERYPQKMSVYITRPTSEIRVEVFKTEDGGMSFKYDGREVPTVFHLLVLMQHEMGFQLEASDELRAEANALLKCWKESR